jgi:uncharacterized membrane protein (UPF0127 family)
MESVVIETAQGSFMMSAELATTPEQRERGLMFRHVLPQGRAMLFVYEEPQIISMWMKNTHIPLDMIFIRPDGRVASAALNAEPMSEKVIQSPDPVLAVLEVPAGTVEQIGLQPGDRVVHPVFGNTE